MDTQHHIPCRPEDVARYVFVPGDPGRVEKISACFDQAEEVAHNREYVVHTGTVDGVEMTAASTGIGCPSAAIAVEELANLGADTFIRLGTAGALQPHTAEGDLVIVTGAVRDEGTSEQYMPPGFPAVADLAVTNALVAAAEAVERRHFVGLTQSKDSFYGEVEPTRMPVAGRLRKRWQAWTAGGVLASEMECSTLFTVASIRDLRAGSVLDLMGDPEGMEDMIRVGIEGVKLLARDDAARASS